MENSKNWKVIRKEEEVYKLFLDLVPDEIQLRGQRICKPCFSLIEKVWKNGKKVNELLEESQVIKQSIVGKLSELYGEQVPQQRDSPPVRAKRARITKACRSLQFSAGSPKSPGVVVRFLAIQFTTHRLTGCNCCR